MKILVITGYSSLHLLKGLYGNWELCLKPVVRVHVTGLESVPRVKSFGLSQKLRLRVLHKEIRGAASLNNLKTMPTGLNRQ